MSEDPTSLENALRGLRPAPLRASLLDRLEACANGTWASESAAESRLEARLSSTPPAGLPPALMARLESAVADTPFPAERNIVLFPKRGEAAPQRSRSWMAAAAAVALAGVFAAFSVPVGKQSPATASAASPAPSSRPQTSPLLVPAGFERDLSEARDEGVVWGNPDQAHRVLKVVYKDRVKMRDAGGRIYEVEQPRVEYILVPEKID